MWLATLGSAFAGAAFLGLFFRSVRLRWPENYSTLRGVLESYVSQGLGRYVTFRTIPVYATGVFVWVTVFRSEGHPDTAVLIMGAAHIAATNGRASLRVVVRLRPGENRINLLSYYLASSLLIAAASLGALSTAQWLKALIPTTDKLSETAWTALFAAVLAVTLQSLGRSDLSDESLLRRARSSIAPAIWRLIDEQAARRATDADFLRALVAAEALQRPPWIRGLERIKGRLAGPGTYGIAQVSADHPLSDAESVQELARRYEGYVPARNDNGYVNRERLEFAIERHNRKRAFVEMATTFYDQLQGTPREATAARAIDGRPVIEVRGVRREFDKWIVSGTASVHEANILWSARGDLYADDGHVAATRGAPGRGDWSIVLPIAASEFTLIEPDEQDGAGEDASRRCTVDLDW